MAKITPRKTTELAPKTQPVWIPPIPQQASSPWQFRLRTLIGLLLAAGPIVMAIQYTFPRVVHDHKLLGFLAVMFDMIALTALVAILISRLPVTLVAVAASGSLFFSVRSAYWFLSLIAHEQTLLGDPIRNSGRTTSPHDISLDVLIATLQIAVSVGLLIGLVVAMRREN